MNQADSKQVGGDHYKGVDPKQEHWNLVLAHNWDYFQAQIIKYIMRWKKKGGKADLEKAKHFLEKYIESTQDPISEVVHKIHGYSVEVAEAMRKDFIVEGHLGSGDTLFTCRKCREKITAIDYIAAFNKHGDCAGEGYVKQE